MAEIQSQGNDSSARTLDPNRLSAPPLIDHNGREVALDSKDFLSISADSDPSPEPSSRPQPLSPGLLRSQHPPKNPRTTQAIISFAPDRLFLISSLICFFAFLLYIIPSSPDIFSFRKYLWHEGFV